MNLAILYAYRKRKAHLFISCCLPKALKLYEEVAQKDPLIIYTYYSITLTVITVADRNS